MLRVRRFFRHLDAKDEPYLRAVFANDAQGIDEIARGWIRGRAALEAYFSANLPRLSEIHSTVEQTALRRYCDVDVETFVLRQTYVYDGTPLKIEAPSTAIWRREGKVWKIALFHSVPLPAAS